MATVYRVLALLRSFLKLLHKILHVIPGVSVSTPSEKETKRK